MKLLSAALFAGLLAHGQNLAPTGTLRATFLGGNPVQARVDPNTKEVTGPAADLTKELARRLKVPYSIAPAAGVRAVIESVQKHTADIGFLAYDVTRAMEVDFTEPYSHANNTYMVLTGSAIRSVADIDRPGVRIGVGAGDAADLFLKRTLKNAQLKPNPGGVMEEALRQLNASEIDAYAANRQRLTEAVARNPGMRILPENFLPVEQSMVVVKGDAASVEFLNRFIDELRTSGFIQGAIDRAKLAGVDVAPKKSK